MKKSEFTVHTVSYRVDPAPAGDLPPQNDVTELQRLQYEADAARAESARIKRELEDVKKQLPSDEQRARWSELQAQFETAEDERKRKAGEFDAWRQQIVEKHTKELDAQRQLTENERAKSDAHERELNQTLIGLAFSGATEWFGPTGKTVLMPDVAQSYFAPHVSVEVVPGVNGGPPRRRVVVKDSHGTVIVDTKSSTPMPFAQAIGEVIDAHPDKKHLLRGSGKVGSGSTGGDQALEGRDLSRLRPHDFRDPAVREAVREQLQAPGGLQIGPGFDRIEQARRNKK